MKKIICTILLSQFLVFAFAQTAGDYRSFTSGNWTIAGNWERFDGTDWVNPAPAAPNSSNGSITIRTGHNITINSSITINQVVVDAGGTITLNTGATISGAGILNVIGTMNWTDGTVSTNLTVASNGTLNITGTGNKMINSAKTLTNNGAIAWANGTIFLSGTGAIIDNYGTISQTGTNNLLQAGGGIPEFRNQSTGIFTKATGVGATIFGATTTNAGIINLNSNTLTIGNNFNNIGTINVAGGGTLQNDASFTWGGTINFENATFSNGKTLVINTLQTVDAFETLKMNASINADATIIGTGSLNIAGTMNWIDGTASVNLVVANNGILNLTGTAPKTINSGKALTNNGTIAWVNGNIVLAGLGTIIDNYSIISQTGTNNLVQAGGGITEFRNQLTGIFTKTTGTGATFFSTATINTGTINLNSNTLSLGNNFNNIGVINIAAGGTLQNDAAFTWGGSINFENATFSNGKTLVINT
ncbi:MAG TPA: hypothetical protein PLC48_05490, partial [Ferruginibacter sp.]|nr:hypothetical protein [Ferruginibacter sp.]